MSGTHTAHQCLSFALTLAVLGPPRENVAGTFLHTCIKIVIYV